MIAPRNTTVLETKSAILDCHASGVPAPKLRWTPAGSNRLPIGSIHLSNGSLLIPDVKNTPDYEGMYNCTALSGTGVRVAQASLTVWGKHLSVKLVISLVYFMYYIIETFVLTLSARYFCNIIR